MIRSSLSAIFELFDDSDSTEEEREELFNQTALMTLSRATSIDTNIHTAEIGTVRKILQELTSQEVTESDVRVAANSLIYEKGSLSKFLAAVSPKISLDRKVALINALGEVILADQRITEREVFFFNHVADALSLKAADLVGLRATQSF